MKYEVKYVRSDGSSYTDTYLPKDERLFCPCCGVRGSLVQENSEGDYYHGPNQACVACGADFTDLPSEPFPNEKWKATLLEGKKP